MPNKNRRPQFLFRNRISVLQAAWAGPLLIYGFGLSTLEAAHILFLFAVSYSLGMPLPGIISDKLMIGAIFIQFTGMFVPAEVSLISHPQDLSHLWLVSAVSMGLSALAYGILYLKVRPCWL